MVNYGCAVEASPCAKNSWDTHHRKREIRGTQAIWRALPFLANILSSDWRLVEEGREVANRLLFVSEGGKRQRNGKPKSASLVSPSRNDPPQMKEEENTVNVTGETPPASQRGASVKMASLAFERSRRSRSLSRSMMMDRNEASKWRRRTEEGRLGVFSPVLPNFPRKKLISDFLPIFWHRRSQAIGGENHNAN